MQYSCLTAWKDDPVLSKLLDIPSPPKHIWYSGDFHADLFTQCVAIVGSRRMTEYGRRVIEQIVPALVLQKKTIVSGFMYGVDQYAHNLAIQSGGKTIAVFGWGISYPLEGPDKKLAEEIISSGGLLLSEWESQRPTLWTFPVRNRIVAALCSDTIVVEAAYKSGSLITAHLAHAFGRTVWAVPGPITSTVSKGTNALIAEGKAKMWIDSSVQERLPLDDPLLRELSDEPQTIDELSRKLRITVSDIGAQLSMLTMTGDVIERGGKYYVGKN